jgi:hypothetical protein
MAAAAPSEAALARRLKALILGGIDMSDVLETATYLLGSHEEAPGHDSGVPWRARRTLETGMCVAYARPFTESRGLQMLTPAPNLPSEFVDAHTELMDLRRTV